MTRFAAPSWELPTGLAAAMADHLGALTERAIADLDLIWQVRSVGNEAKVRFYTSIAPPDTLVDVRQVPTEATRIGREWRPHLYTRAVSIYREWPQTFLWSPDHFVATSATAPLDVESVAIGHRELAAVVVVRMARVDGLWTVESPPDLRCDPWSRIATVAAAVRDHLAGHAPGR